MRLTVYFPEDSPTTHEFVGNRLAVGRLGDNDVALDEASVSSRHAEIEVQDDSAILRDLDSTNGTFLNGNRVSGEVPLKEGDEIFFGNVRSVFMEPVAAAAEAPVAEAVEAAASAPSAAGTGRPEKFRYLSPVPRAVVRRDMLGMAAWGAAGLAVLVAAYALFVILGA